jgi:hypothetical protein
MTVLLVVGLEARCGATRGACHRRSTVLCSSRVPDFGKCCNAWCRQGQTPQRAEPADGMRAPLKKSDSAPCDRGGVGTRRGGGKKRRGGENTRDLSSRQVGSPGTKSLPKCKHRPAKCTPVQPRACRPPLPPPLGGGWGAHIHMRHWGATGSEGEGGKEDGRLEGLVEREPECMKGR